MTYKRRFFLSGDERQAIALDEKPDLVVVLSAPREKGAGRNANYARLQRGMELQVQYRTPCLISGYRQEKHHLRAEVLRLRDENPNLKPDPFIHLSYCLRSRYTAANAANTLLWARLYFEFDCPRPRTVVVCTHDWHVPRTELLFEATQELLAAWDPDWAAATPLHIRFSPVSSDDLDPDFVQQLRAAEEVKILEARTRLEMWRRFLLFQAPTFLGDAFKKSRLPARERLPDFGGLSSWAPPASRVEDMPSVP